MTLYSHYAIRDTCYDVSLSAPAFRKIDDWGAIEHETKRCRKRVRRATASAPTESEFRTLVDSWHEQTWHISSIKKRTSHPDYLKIIGMGQVAIPWILQELRNEPDYWFVALESITRDDPAPNAETLAQLRDAWLEWGEKRAR